ncbi:MAG: 50S ribosomal protein L4 [Candidatus Magasanikbacteria bacterium RIFOXYC12_FULL_33_11]|uniref:Large ribosomal subunit protein uL4 n=2 Tax=Candidatus Magasanikiibacteriota TaxID=1752731 RepID=A0A1F6NRW7_9BACT|nr:MAG: 50S ribosomal protein L4 [Candidatus Magasanikbacteria bacterium RIFOXYC12_FULL_33_11]PIZ95487.1 MAG: 50S ribosomal protein L4 [Candidatus Magasanikbacteria bacterium CG_4_10_14_0_2_um_filter_33_14]
MTKIAMYNSKGEQSKDIELNDAIFATPINKEVVHQVYTAMRANARQPWADTKDRSEVSGGGKKPWKQKGTGRARHGSNRSPIWSGGGITFGPLSTRNYKQKINKKVNKLATCMCLSDKVSDNKMVVVDKFEFVGKTKEVVNLAKKVLAEVRPTLVVLNEESTDENLKALRNIKNFKIVRAQDLNVLDLMNNQYLLISEEGIKFLEKRLVK